MKNLYFLSAAIISLIIYSAPTVNAQGVSVNSNSAPPDSSAMIDVSSTTKGALIPRMTTVQRDAIVNPATGLQVYNADCNTINLNTGTPSSPSWAQILTTNSLSAGVSIVANPAGIICTGTSVTFTATPANGGASPTYQWRVNGGNVGTNSSTYTTSTLLNGDVVTCIMASNAPCVTIASVTSNPITEIVDYSPPATPSVINGPNIASKNSIGNIYSTPAIASATNYIWTVTSGPTIVSGQGTNSINVTMGSQSGTDTITIAASNVCGTSAVTTLPVYLGIKTFMPTDTGANGKVQSFTIGMTGVYTITVYGAQGAYYCNPIYPGGFGASMQGDFTLSQGTVLNILVGQAPPTGTGGGGGGTFIVNASGNTPLIVAGGGGGGGCTAAGLPGNTGTAGSDGFGGAQGMGGNNGGGGGGAAGYGGGGGGGFCGNGGNAGSDYCFGGSGGNGCANGGDGQCSVCTATMGLSYLNGGTGGNDACYGSGPAGDGGYGGGGGSIHGNACGGGGGGYSGGGGGGYYDYPGHTGVHGYGGGGGSYNSGTNQVNTSGVQSGSGMVVITF